MREILFRGKRLDNGEWVYGYFVENESDVYRAYIVTAARWETDDDGDTDLIETTVYEVDPATVGQYTGLTDRNGVKIFEGDIVRITLPIGGGQQIVQVSEVYFDNGCFCVNWGGDFRPRPRTSIDSFVPATIFEIIGNIYDNPELLE